MLCSNLHRWRFLLTHRTIFIKYFNELNIKRLIGRIRNTKLTWLAKEKSRTCSPRVLVGKRDYLIVIQAACTNIDLFLQRINYRIFTKWRLHCVIHIFNTRFLTNGSALKTWNRVKFTIYVLQVGTLPILYYTLDIFIYIFAWY